MENDDVFPEDAPDPFMGVMAVALFCFALWTFAGC
jgi:hypothetical protein